MNNFTGVGRIGRDAVVRHTTNGKAVAGFSLAIESGFGDNKQTTWLDCSAWGDRFAKVAEYIKKGDRLGVSGEIATREHEGKTYITLNVRDITLLAPKRDEHPAGSKSPPRGTTTTGNASQADGFEDDDIPF
jgi:single-strand DNA-binding protein